MGDDSTDISSTEQSMWFARSCNKGDITVNFLGVNTLEKADAESIVMGLRYIAENNLNMTWQEFIQMLVCVTVNGASVMLGHKSGVATHLKQLQPSLLIVHCMPHRLELGYGQGCKDCSLYQKTIKTLAMGLYYFYYRSPLNRTNLRRAAEAYDANELIETHQVKSTRGAPAEELSSTSSASTAIPPAPGKVRIPVRAGGTRWVQHTTKALMNISKSFPYLVLHLTQVSFFLFFFFLNFKFSCLSEIFI